MTFTGTLADGVIRWDGPAPPDGQPVRVTATVADADAADPAQGAALASLFDELAAMTPEERGFTYADWKADRAAERSRTNGVARDS